MASSAAFRSKNAAESARGRKDGDTQKSLQRSDAFGQGRLRQFRISQFYDRNENGETRKHQSARRGASGSKPQGAPDDKGKYQVPSRENSGAEIGPKNHDRTDAQAGENKSGFYHSPEPGKFRQLFQGRRANEDRRCDGHGPQCVGSPPCEPCRRVGTALKRYCTTGGSAGGADNRAENRGKKSERQHILYRGKIGVPFGETAYEPRAREGGHAVAGGGRKTCDRRYGVGQVENDVGKKGPKEQGGPGGSLVSQQYGDGKPGSGLKNRQDAVVEREASSRLGKRKVSDGKQYGAKPGRRPSLLPVG